MRTETEYALAIFGKQIGPWRTDRYNALKDALRTGNGSRDRASKTIYLTVPADIISRSVQVSAKPIR